MPRAIVRTLLAFLCLATALLLAFASPGVVRRSAAQALAVGHHQGPWETHVSGAIRHIGLSGLDRPTAAALAEARVPEPVASDSAQPAPPQPAAQQQAALQATLPAAAPPARRPAPAAPPVSAPPRSAPPAIVSTQQALINQDRAQNGLPPLAWSSCLYTIAVQNAQRMAAQGYISHTNGPTLDLGCGLGSHAGENVGYTSGGINDAYLNTLFMNSPEHRANILSPYYHYVGTAWRVAANGYAYIAVEFS